MLLRERAPQVYNLDHAATVLGVSTRTLHRLVDSGQLRSVRVGKRKLLPIGEVERLLAGDTLGGEGGPAGL